MSTLAEELFITKDIHPGGDCACGRFHVSAGIKLGYSQCRRCGKLRPRAGVPKRPKDGFEKMRALAGREINHRAEAVAFIRRWLSRAERTAVVLKVGPRDKLPSVDRVHDRIGSRTIRALRRAGFREEGIGLGGGFEKGGRIALLLCEAVKKISSEGN